MKAKFEISVRPSKLRSSEGGPLHSFFEAAMKTRLAK